MTHDDMIDIYVARMDAIRRAAQALEWWAENLGDIGPDEVSWGHIGAAAYTLAELENILNRHNIDYDRRL